MDILQAKGVVGGPKGSKPRDILITADERSKCSGKAEADGWRHCRWEEREVMEQVYLLSLGCAKNQVDSELMRGVLAAEGYRLTERPELAEIIIINTCGFIEAAKKESIEAILELAACKQQGCCRQLVVVGCMAEKYADEMREAMPEIDLIMGSKSYGPDRDSAARSSAGCRAAEDYSRRALVPGAATAYLKSRKAATTIAAIA